MPTFIDRHRFAAMLSAVRHQLHPEVVRGLVDEHGGWPSGKPATWRQLPCSAECARPNEHVRHHAHKLNRAIRVLPANRAIPFRLQAALGPAAESQEQVVLARWH